MPTLLTRLRHPDIRALCARNHISHIYLTGSYARGEEHIGSDVDIIYEKLPTARFTLFNIGDMKSTLEETLERPVDLISERSIRSELRSAILSDKMLIF